MLAISLVLHAALFLLPPHREPPASTNRSLSVDVWLDAIRPPEHEDTPEPTEASQLEETPPRPEMPTQAIQPVTAEGSIERPEPDAQPEEKVVTVTPVTMAALLESAVYFRLPPTQSRAVPRILGSPPPPSLPENLSRPVLPATSNVFDGTVAPTETELMDQWVEAGGIAHAVIRAADGNVYCGRMEPWDPMNPLVEHIPMWRACAGGGKRSRRSQPFSSRE